MAAARLLSGKDRAATMDAEAVEAAAAFGLPAEERENMERQAREQEDAAALEVWPENWRPLMLALAMQTQVRASMNGAIGFDYLALPVVETRIGLPSPVDQEELADEFAAFRRIEQVCFSQ